MDGFKSAGYIIRDAVGEDASQLIALFQQHAQYENTELRIGKQRKQLQSIVDWPMKIFVVEQQNQLVGYLSVIKQCSTWDMAYYLYIDCLYLALELRGQNIGEKLMMMAHDYAKSLGINHLQWQTPVDNTHAIGFYQRLGAECKAKQRFYWQVNDN